MNLIQTKIVIETIPGPPVTSRYLLEVRSFDTVFGILGTPSYYLPGSTVPQTIGMGSTLEYLNDSALLSQIVTELQDIDAGIPSSLGQKPMADSMSVTIANNQLGIARTPGILRPTTSGNVNSASATFYSVSVANVGAANGTVLSGTTIKPGEVLNFSADAVNNYFTSFDYNATGTEFIIIYVA